LNLKPEVLVGDDVGGCPEMAFQIRRDVDRVGSKLSRTEGEARRSCGGGKGHGTKERATTVH